MMIQFDEHIIQMGWLNQAGQEAYTFGGYCG